MGGGGESTLHVDGGEDKEETGRVERERRETPRRIMQSGTGTERLKGCCLSGSPSYILLRLIFRQKPWFLHQHTVYCSGSLLFTVRADIFRIDRESFHQHATHTPTVMKATSILPIDHRNNESQPSILARRSDGTTASLALDAFCTGPRCNG